MNNFCSAGVFILFMLLLLVIARFIVRALRDDYRVFHLADPVVLDPDNPKDQYEARCIDEQMSSGRELNGYKWKGE